jgi:hypothetical protein
MAKKATACRATGIKVERKADTDELAVSDVPEPAVLDDFWPKALVKAVKGVCMNC